MRLQVLPFALVAAVIVALVLGAVALFVSGVLIAISIAVPVFIVGAILFGKVEVIRK